MNNQGVGKFGNRHHLQFLYYEDAAQIWEGKLNSRFTYPQNAVPDVHEKLKTHRSTSQTSLSSRGAESMSLTSIVPAI